MADLSTRSSIAKDRLITPMVATVILLLFGLIALKFPAAVARLNNAVTAIQIRLLPPVKLSSLPVIVEIDEQSLATYGQWPWPRYQVARLLASIQTSGATAVAIDTVFVEPDRTSPVEIKRVIARDLQQNLDLSSVDQKFLDYDAVLGQTLKKGPFVTSYFFTFNLPNNNSCFPKSTSGAFLTQGLAGNKLPPLQQADSVTCNVPPIQGSTIASGFINSSPDSDGIYRKTPLIMRYKDRLLPSLALQAYLSANHIAQFLVSPSATGLNLQLGKLTVPLDNSGNLLLNLPTSIESFDRISAVELLSGKVSPDRIKNKIVFLGISAVGLHEVRPTPNNPAFLGVELHATVIDNLAKQNFLNRPDNAQNLELLLSLSLGLFLFLLLSGRGPFFMICLPLAVVVCLGFTSQIVLQKTGLVFSPALPVLMTLLVLLALAILKYVREYLHSKAMAVIVSKSQDGIIGSICSMSEYRDPDTGAHIKRTQAYIKALAIYLQKNPKYKTELTDETIEILFRAAPLHDIGKIGIRDYILLKPEQLDQLEFEIMKTHPVIGADIIRSVAEQVGWNPFMSTAHQICLYHQEKWDGSGYPQGLKGEEIPLSARLMALADVYDALISERVYKPAFSHTKALEIIKAGKNRHFDPLIVDAFETIHTQFEEIARRFVDPALP